MLAEHLLALLFAAGGLIPRPPLTDSANSGPQLPKIRIYSELKGPEAVVIDTSRPIIVPTPSQDDTGKAVAPPHPQVAENVGQLVSPSLKQPDPKEQNKVGPELPPRSNVGKVHIKRPPMSYAQRPDVGLFDGPWTSFQQDTRFRESFAQLVPRPQRQHGTRREAAWTRTEHERRAHFGWFGTGW